STSPCAPSTWAIHGAPAHTRAASARPRPSASHVPSTPAASARVRSPRPTRRATLAVVAYARKMHSPTTVISRVEATVSPASGAVARGPTITGSGRPSGGLARGAPSEGSARARLRRSGGGGRLLTQPTV